MELRSLLCSSFCFQHCPWRFGVLRAAAFGRVVSNLYIYVYVFICVCTLVPTYVCMCACVYVCMFAQMLVRASVPIAMPQARVHVYLPVYRCVASFQHADHINHNDQILIYIIALAGHDSFWLISSCRN